MEIGGISGNSEHHLDSPSLNFDAKIARADPDPFWGALPLLYSRYTRIGGIMVQLPKSI
jgi:hypothetical protein